MHGQIELRATTGSVTPGVSVNGPPCKSLKRAVLSRLVLRCRVVQSSIYSLLNASNGSTRTARRAGTRHAASTTASSTPATPTNVKTSVGFTP